MRLTHEKQGDLFMKNKRIVFLCLLGLILLLGGYFSSILRESNNRRELFELAKSSIGSEEDPAARARYEWMRLRNPGTGQIPRNIRVKELRFAATLPTKESVVSMKKFDGGADIQTLTWTPRGPFNLGGRTRALAIDIMNENIILAGGVSGGMWRSTDGGSTWTKTTDPGQIHSVTSIVQDIRSGKTSTWYYGTGEFSGNSASGGGGFFLGDGISKSTDGGISWTQLPSTVSGTPESFEIFDIVWNIVIDPSNTGQDEVYAATYSAIYRSTNGGSTWNVVLGGSSPFSPFVDVTITSTGVLYATLSSDGGNKGIWRSVDGTTWTNITPAGWPSIYNLIVIGIFPSNDTVVYFLAETPGSGLNDHSFWKYTYISGNGSGSGGSWVDRSANLPFGGPTFGPPVGDFDTQGSYDMVIKVKPDDENVVFIGGTNLYRSTDGFATTGNTTWIGGYSTANNVSTYGGHHPDQHAVVFLPSSSSTMFSGHDGGVSKTTNNLASTVSWTSLNNGYSTTQYYTIAIDHATSGNNIIIGGMQDNGTWFTNSTSATSPWVELFSGDGAYCAIADGRTSYYVSSQNGKTFRFVLDDSGILSVWTNITPAGGSGFLFINPFVLDSDNTDVMYFAGGDRLWRNSDLTAIPLFSNDPTNVNWTELTNSALSVGTITALGVSRPPANRLYYGSDDGQLFRLDGANSGDPIPTDVWTGAGFPANAYVSCISVDPTDADKAMVVFSNYEVLSLFYTTNGGTNWTAVSGNLEENADGSGNGPSARWAAILPASGSTIYFVGTSTGLYSTTSLNGASTVWALEGGSTVGNVVVDMIDTRESDGLLVVATHGNGVYSSSIVTPVKEVDRGLPTQFALHQNYPNPFNPSTRIEFDLRQEEIVKLQIYDVTGKEVARVIDDQRMSPGRYRVQWNALSSSGLPLPSGVYLYRLQAGQFAEQAKMVLVR